MTLKLSLILCIGLMLVHPSDIHWEMTKDDGMITTYIGSESGTGLRPTRSIMLVNEPLEKVYNTIMNIERYPKWVPYCGSARVLERSDSTIHFYQVLEMPMVKNRDIVIRAEVEQIANGIRISMTAAPDKAKKNADMIRITDFTAVYTITKRQHDNRTLIELTNRVDPGGYIPTFAINWASKSQPYETFSNLKREIIR